MKKKFDRSLLYRGAVILNRSRGKPWIFVRDIPYPRGKICLCYKTKKNVYSIWASDGFAGCAAGFHVMKFGGRDDKGRPWWTCCQREVRAKSIQFCGGLYLFTR